MPSVFEDEILSATGLPRVSLVIESAVKHLLRTDGSTKTDLEGIARRLSVAKISHDEIPCDGLLIPHSDSYEIVLNASAPFSRRRFSLAHELGHIVLHRILPNTKSLEGRNLFSVPGNESEERFCDAFAAELLMPTESFTRSLGSTDFGPTRLRELASEYGVSLQACAIRARDLLGDIFAVFRASRVSQVADQWVLDRPISNFNEKPLYPLKSTRYQISSGQHKVVWIKERFKNRELELSIGGLGKRGDSSIAIASRRRQAQGHQVCFHQSTD